MALLLFSNQAKNPSHLPLFDPLLDLCGLGVKRNIRKEPSQSSLKCGLWTSGDLTDYFGGS